MSKSAYIQLVEGSTMASVNIGELKQLLEGFKEQLAHTGEQLDWGYADAGFPYTVEDSPQGNDQWLKLTGINKLYRALLVGVGTRQTDNGERSVIQFTVPDTSSHGDMEKALAFCKRLAKKLKAEAHLFNGRVMYFNPRK
ncbi:DUF1885 family protein [Gorillibacterium massiliense]|uniref:DUF1885 family protein n=1 Tax=Gorillibacterium massiliense TaxID=1280390 RepID=UPI0004B1962B|nr:DUF1885 family protein [Gorillibacterium massiliense]